MNNEAALKAYEPLCSVFQHFLFHSSKERENDLFCVTAAYADKMEKLREQPAVIRNTITPRIKECLNR